MEWWLSLLLILGSLAVLMAAGVPTAFSFMFVNIIGAFLLFGGEPGLRQLIFSLEESVTSFVLLPLPLFILMGEVMFHSGIAPLMISALDKWVGRLPGRLSFLAVGSGTLLSTLSGSSMASTAVLGSVLVPEMEKRGYKKPMSLGPILGSGGLAMMIPPTGLGVLLAAIGEFSVGGLLIAIIIPGLLMALLYAIYIIGRCWLQPSIAPPYEMPPVPLSDKLISSVRHILPLGVIVFFVVGVIFLGFATPSEAAATGAIACFILAAAYKTLNWGVVKKSLTGTTMVTVMSLMIITGATAFSQILAFSGASRGLVNLAVDLPLNPIMMIVAMQLVVLFMGCFVDPVSIMMITLPIFMPIVYSLDFNPIWFGVIMLLNVEMAQTTPPFGMGLFVMKGVAPADTTMGDIYKAGLPFLVCDAIAMVLLIAFPTLALWLPGLMRG